MPRFWILWMLISAASYSGMAILMKVSSTRLGWQKAAFWGMLAESLLVVLVAALWPSQGAPKPSTWGYVAAALVGLSSMVGFLTFMVGCVHGQVTVVQTGVSVGTMVVVALVAVPAFRERLSASQWLGVLLGVVSIVLIVCPRRQ